jgi:hypothetical protein
MLEDIKQKIYEYKYQIGGIIIFLIVSGIYEYYMNNKKKDIKQEKLVENDKSIQDELQKLKQELVLQKKIIQSYKTKESEKPKKISLYENSQYNFERLPKKIINVQYKADQTSEKIKLHEPLKIDKLSDIYLSDFFTEHSITGGDGANRDLFILGIDEFNIQSISGSSEENETNKYYNKIIIPNISESGKVISYNSGKYDFISTINPTTLTEFNISLTLKDGTSVLGSSTEYIWISFMIVARE